MRYLTSTTTEIDPLTYDGLNADKIRNALSHETDLDVLRSFVADPRKRVSEKAAARLAKLSAPADSPPADPVPPLDNPSTEAVVDRPVEALKVERKRKRKADAEEQAATPSRYDVQTYQQDGEDRFDVVDCADPKSPAVVSTFADKAEAEQAAATLEGGGKVRKKTGRRKNADASAVVGPAEPKEAKVPKEAKPKEAKPKEAKVPKERKVRAVHGPDRTCPKCGETKPIETGFGWRKLPLAVRDGGGNGQTYLGPQPHCSVCRKLASKRAATDPVRASTREAVAEKRAKRQAREQARAEARALREVAAESAPKPEPKPKGKRKAATE